MVAGFEEIYNTAHLHSAIVYVTPLDKLEGRAEAIQAERERKLRAARDPKAYVSDPDNLSAYDDRARDVSLVVDRLDRLSGVGVDAARIDTEHVGIAGHSFGAHTAMLCGGLSMVGVTGLAEPRADALLLMSPQGTGKAITPASYATITLPTLVVTGQPSSPGRSRDGGPIGPAGSPAAASTLPSRSTTATARRPCSSISERSSASAWASAPPASTTRRRKASRRSSPRARTTASEADRETR